jgi:hypothetical protein
MAMKILVACEYSGAVRDAFLAKGHDAMSCDLLPTDVPGPHYQGDVRDIINDGWDMMFAFPTCTYLCSSGMHWTTRGKRDPQLTEDALDFVRFLLDAPIQKIVLENPVGAISTRIRKPEQKIQPWHYGDDASKKTCLWLKGVRPLEIYLPKVCPPKGWQKVMCAMDMVECECCGEPFCPECNDHYTDCNCIGPTQDEATYKMVDGVLFATLEHPAPKMIWGNQTPSGQNKLGPSEDRWKLRSKTYRGIADAFAEQWG